MYWSINSLPYKTWSLIANWRNIKHAPINHRLEPQDAKFLVFFIWYKQAMWLIWLQNIKLYTLTCYDTKNISRYNASQKLFVIYYIYT